MKGHGTSVAQDNYSFQKIVAALGVFLLVMKFIAWYLTSSVAIFTDALESIVNVIAAFIGLYALYLSSKPRDKDHPFGHGKAELISSSLEGSMIAFAGLMIILEAVRTFLDPSEIKSLDLGLIIIALAALVNYAVGRTAIRKGLKNHSPALVASGKHLCSDTYSSVGITLGLIIMFGLSSFGYDVWWIDPLIAFIMGMIILITGLKVIVESINGVMDKADDELVSKVTTLINSRRHVHWVDVHDLRIAKYGNALHVDLHIIFPKHMTVLQQSTEIEEIREAICSELDYALDLVVMGEPCTDNECHICGMNCENRTHEHDEKVFWTSDTITDHDQNH